MHLTVLLQLASTTWWMHGEELLHAAEQRERVLTTNRFAVLPAASAAGDVLSLQHCAAHWDEHMQWMGGGWCSD